MEDFHMQNIRKKIISINLAAFLGVTCSGFPGLTAGAETGGVVINELCAKNTTMPASDGNCYDFVELYNSTGSDINISGYGLTDDDTKPFRFKFPDGSVIKAHDRIIVYLNSKEFKLEGQYTGFFGLSTDGETVSLFTPDEKLADQVTFANMDADTSYGRISDGDASLAVISMTPGGANSNAQYIKEFVEAPVLSVSSGFYDNEFDLTLSAPAGTKIYYTLDSSTPTAASTEYTGSLKVSRPVKTEPENPEQETEIKDPKNKRPGAENPFSFFNPFSPQNSAQNKVLDDKSAYVIRAVAVDSKGNVSDSVCGIYFIGLKNTKSYYQNMKVISLVTDSSNLLDSNTGIFTNYNNEGREWERPANLQIFSDGNYSFEQNIGIRVHGGYTRRFEQKSLNIYARGDYGPSKFNYDLFSGNLISEATGQPITEFDSFILRNAGNDSESTRFRDKLNQTLVNDRDFLTQGMEPCIVFINGAFYGHMEITEKVSPEYIKSHLDVGKKNIVIIKNQELNEGTEEDLKEYNDLWNWIKAADFTDDAAYEELCSKVDMDNFADYMSSNIYIGNKDWGSNNVSLWKSTKIKEENPYMDGRWRFNMFDTEYSANMYDQIPATTNTFSQILNQRSFITDLFKGALKNEKFKNKFAAAFMDIAGNNFNTEKVDSLINDFSSSYKDMVTDTTQIFYNKNNYINDVNKVKTFFDNRYKSIVNYLKSTLQLTGTVVPLTVSNDPQFGTVKVGTVSTDSTYTGNYYSDFPVTVSAYAKDGYKAVAWKLSDGRTIQGSTVDILLNEAVSAQPVYEKVNAGQTSENTTTTEGINNTDQIFYGDLNGDEMADLTDLTILSLYLMKAYNFNTTQQKASDIDRNGITDIRDLAYFKQYVSKDSKLSKDVKIGR